MNNLPQNNMNMESLIAIFGRAPVALAILIGEDMILEYVNAKMIEFWRKTSDIIGRPIVEALPEIKSQIFPDLLTKVFKTGVIHRAENELVLLEKDGILGKYYVNYIYSPIYKDKHIIGVSILATEIVDPNLFINTPPNL